MNCRTCLKIDFYSFLAPRTPALIGILCLKPQDKCLLANQMSLETIVGGFVVVCICMPGLWSSHIGFYPKQRSHLKGECTSLACAIFPGCTWSKSSQPSPTPGVQMIHSSEMHHLWAAISRETGGRCKRNTPHLDASPLQNVWDSDAVGKTKEQREDLIGRVGRLKSVPIISPPQWTNRTGHQWPHH